MNPEQQRIAIAEWCGWKSDGYGHWKNPARNCHEDIDGLPDYLNDLNAMHEAEGKLEGNQIDRYLSELLDIVELQFRLCRASATQRAEALLKTIGAWKE